jgi:hypothetical protein
MSDRSRKPLEHAMALVVVVALTGCNSSPKPADGVDWSKLPVVKATATASGRTFTIDLLEGEDEGKPFRPETLPATTLGHGVAYEIGDIGVEISIFVNAHHKTLDDFVKGKNTTQWLRNDALPDGFVVSYENIYKDDYLVEVQRPALICSARLWRWKSASSTSVVDKVPLVEKMCLSMAVAP